MYFWWLTNVTVLSIASSILPVYLPFFASNGDISCSSISIIYELSLDSAAQSPIVDMMLRSGFLLASHGALSHLSVQPTADKMVYMH